jgi:hypothetical protein
MIRTLKWVAGIWVALFVLGAVVAFVRQSGPVFKVKGRALSSSKLGLQLTIPEAWNVMPSPPPDLDLALQAADGSAMFGIGAAKTHESIDVTLDILVKGYGEKVGRPKGLALAGMDLGRHPAKSASFTIETVKGHIYSRVLVTKVNGYTVCLTCADNLIPGLAKRAPCGEIFKLLENW